MITVAPAPSWQLTHLFLHCAFWSIFKLGVLGQPTHSIDSFSLCVFSLCGTFHVPSTTNFGVCWKTDQFFQFHCSFWRPGTPLSVWQAKQIVSLQKIVDTDLDVSVENSGPGWCFEAFFFLTVLIFRKLWRRSSELWMWRKELWTQPMPLCTPTFGTSTHSTIRATSQRMVARAIKTQREEMQKLPEPGWRRWKRTTVSKLLEILKIPWQHHAATLVGLSWFINSWVFQRHRSVSHIALQALHGTKLASWSTTWWKWGML